MASSDDKAESRATYMRAYRQNRPDYAWRAKRLGVIRGKAALIIAMQHPIEFQALINEMCTDEGLEPPQ